MLKRKLKLRNMFSCSHCNGSGAASGSESSNCTTCNGSGRVTCVQQTIPGQMQTALECPTCGGDGKLSAINVHIVMAKALFVKKK